MLLGLYPENRGFFTEQMVKQKQMEKQKQMDQEMEKQKQGQPVRVVERRAFRADGTAEADGAGDGAIRSIP